jgi:anionic cell wall polymer biosynthesis LytR-Cps2A-Psr (LCP) family protein
MNMEGFEAATDAVGGVQLVMLEDFTNVSSSMKEGEAVTLNGAQALSYIRDRHADEGGLDPDRAPRQVQYMKAFFGEVKDRTKENITFPVTLYTKLGDYIESDMSLSEVSYFAQNILKNDLRDENIITVPGVGALNEDGSAYYYNVDDAALQDMIREIFYVKQ